MSTNPEQPQAKSPASEERYDELTGVYGFFRRHQKLLLYTAGLFTLLTFSITGSLQGLVSGVFNEDIERSTLVVNGERVKLTSEDYRYGNLLSRHVPNGLPAGVALPVQAGEGGDSELGEVFAMLRRVAVATRRDHGQVRSRDLEAGGGRERASVHAVESVAAGVGRDARRAADARDHGDPLRR